MGRSPAGLLTHSLPQPPLPFATTTPALLRLSTKDAAQSVYTQPEIIFLLSFGAVPADKLSVISRLAVQKLNIEHSPRTFVCHRSRGIAAHTCRILSRRRRRSSPLGVRWIALDSSDRRRIFRLRSQARHTTPVLLPGSWNRCSDCHSVAIGPHCSLQPSSQTTPLVRHLWRPAQDDHDNRVLKCDTRPDDA